MRAFGLAARSAASVFTVALMLGGAAFAQDCCPKELVDAANKEGKVVLYTALLLDNEQIVAKEFNKRFPGVKVDIVRAPGGRLFTRIETEAAGNQLAADVVDMTDRGLLKRIENLFGDYAPPNAAEIDNPWAVSKIFWPRSVQVYGLAYNPALVSNPPASWQDLAKPEYKGKLGLVIAGSGGTTWTKVLFQRQVLGLDYWKALAAQGPRLYESNGPLASAIVRGEVQVAALLVNAALPLQRDGAPIKIVYPPEGMPTTPGVVGIVKSAAHPNAARLFLNWFLSVEGQNAMVDNLGFLSLVKGAKRPAGMPSDANVWISRNEEYEKLRDQWIGEWNTMYGYNK
jgi:iron(III) transport system substrate-binding protein